MSAPCSSCGTSRQALRDEPGACCPRSSRRRPFSPAAAVRRRRARPHGGSVLGTQTPTDGRYAELVDDLTPTGTGVWIESDFVKAYFAGPTRYHYVLSAALALARLRGWPASRSPTSSATTTARPRPRRRRCWAQPSPTFTPPRRRRRCSSMSSCPSWAACRGPPRPRRSCACAVATARARPPERASPRSTAMPPPGSTSSTSARVCRTIPGTPPRAPPATTRCGRAGTRPCAGGGAG